MISEKDEQNFSFPTTGHKLVYVKLHINQLHLHLLLSFRKIKAAPNRSPRLLCKILYSILFNSATN